MTRDIHTGSTHNNGVRCMLPLVSENIPISRQDGETIVLTVLRSSIKSNVQKYEIRTRAY